MADKITRKRAQEKTFVRALSLLATLFFTVAIVSMCPLTVHADVNWRFSKSSVTINAAGEYEYLYVSGDLDSSEYSEITVYSPDTSIVAIEKVTYLGNQEYEVEIRRAGPGEVTLYADIYDTVTCGNSRIYCTVSCPYTEFKLNVSNITFGKNMPYSEFWIYMLEGTDTSIIKAASSKQAVASVKLQNGYVVVTPKKKGTAVITVTDSIGRTKDVTVTVTAQWKKENLKNNTWTSVNHPTKKITIYSKPGAKYTFRIGRKKYKGKIGKKGRAVVRLNKQYRLKTKYSLKVSYKGVRITKKGRVKSNVWTQLGSLLSCSNAVNVTVYNVTKGDVVYLKTYEHTYKEKIWYKVNNNNTTVHFNTNYRSGYYNQFEIIVKNKYGQTLCRETKKITWRRR